MPITISFDISSESCDTNDRSRISSCFQRLGWESIGGSTWRYPHLDSDHIAEDWLNHVIPALMYFRAVVESKGIEVTKFSLDTNSSSAFKNEGTLLGSVFKVSSDIEMYSTTSTYGNTLSENRLRKFIKASADDLTKNSTTP